MRKKLIIAFMVILSSTYYVAPVWGHSMDLIEFQNVETDNTFEVHIKEKIIHDSVENAIDLGVENIKFCAMSKIDFTTGWLTENVNVRYSPDLSNDSNIAFVKSKLSEIQYKRYDDNWCLVSIDDKNYYIYSEYISDEPITAWSYSTPNNGIKSYMPYTAITSTSSPQYKLQQKAYTGNYGIRQVNGRYCVAVGSAYTTTIGQYFDLVLANGSVIPCILADCKADKDTNESNTITSHDGSLVEFVVSSGNLSSMVKRMGDISYACDAWNSTIVEIILYDEVESY